MAQLLIACCCCPNEKEGTKPTTKPSLRFPSFAGLWVCSRPESFHVQGDHYISLQLANRTSAGYVWRYGDLSRSLSYTSFNTFPMYIISLSLTHKARCVGHTTFNQGFGFQGPMLLMLLHSIISVSASARQSIAS